MTSVSRLEFDPAAAVPMSGTVTSTSESDTTWMSASSASKACEPSVSSTGSNSTVSRLRSGLSKPDPKIWMVLPPLSGPPLGSIESTTGAPKS